MKLGEPSPERLHPRSYIVPKALPFQLPSDLAYAGPMLRRIVGPGQPSFTLDATLWGPSVASLVHSILIIPAVFTVLQWEWGFRVMSHPKDNLTEQRPLVFKWASKDRARVFNGQNRTGEVLIWPLKAIPSNQPQPT